MNEIKQLQKNNNQYKQMIVQKRLQSKKNKIYLVKFNGKLCVLKFFSSKFEKNLELDYSILSKGSSKLNIPAPIKIDSENNFLLISYIDGINICDFINDKKINFSEKQKIISLLAKWLYDFHSFFKKSDKILIRGDSILRNFILTDRIWGVDFEEARYAQNIEDISCLGASILNTDPMFTEEKILLTSFLIENYEKLINKELKDINYYISSELLKYNQWRNNKLSIERFADKIGKEDIIFKRNKS